MPQHADLIATLEAVLRDTLGANISAEEIKAAQNLEDLVPLDSVATLEFAVGLETHLGIRIERENFNRDFLTDLPGLLRYLQQRTNAA